jgi:anti-sigma regulatory factor (Ser/Thr protein kinase)
MVLGVTHAETFMSGRADVVCGSSRVDGHGPEHGSGAGPAPKKGLRVATASWPLTSSLVLGALPTAPGCGRLHASAVLYEWGLGELAETAGLVVSELVTNAVQASGETAIQAHTGLPVVHLRLLSDRSHVVVEVWDSNPQAPIAKQAEPDDESGRGLMLVEALCEHWGSEAVPGWGGKVVWAQMRVLLTSKL